MENEGDGAIINNHQSFCEQSITMRQSTLITSLPITKQYSLQSASLTVPHRRNIHKPSHLLQASLLEIKRAELLKQLCVIAIFNYASKKLSDTARKTQRVSQIQHIKKSFSVSTLLKELSPMNSLHANTKILICSSKLRHQKQSNQQSRWLVNIAHILHKNRKKYVMERKTKAMESFQIVLNSKVQDLKMDIKSFNIDDVEYSLDPISLLNANTGPKERQDRKTQLFNVVNKDIMQMTSRNPGNQYTVIQQIVNIIKNKILHVKGQMIELQKNIGQLSYRDFKQFYEQIKKINFHMGDVLSILFKYLSIEQNKTMTDFGETKSRKGFAMKKDDESYYQIVTLSLKNIIQNFNRLHNNLTNISSKYFTKSKPKKITNQNFKKFLYSSSKLRYHLIYLNKQIVFLNSKLPVEKEESMQKPSDGFRSMRKVLYDKYFFNRNQVLENEKQAENAQKIIFSTEKHKIADNRLQIKRRLYNAPCTNRSINNLLKEYRGMNRQSRLFQ